MRVFKTIFIFLFLNNLWGSEAIDNKFNDLIEFKKNYFEIKKILNNDPIKNYFEPRIGYSYRCQEEFASDGLLSEGTVACLDLKTNNMKDLVQVFQNEGLFSNPTYCNQSKTIKISLRFITDSPISWTESAEVLIPRDEDYLIIKTIPKNMDGIEIYKASCNLIYTALATGKNIFDLENIILPDSVGININEKEEYIISGSPRFDEDNYSYYPMAIRLDSIGNRYEGPLDSYHDRDGLGKQTYSTGDTFNGEFASDYRIYGEYFYLDRGCFYKGQYVRNLPNGFGRYECEDGSSYEGVFVDEIFEGAGTFTYTTGAKIIGLFKNGEPDVASFIKSNGELLYSGGYKNWKWNGIGSSFVDGVGGDEKDKVSYTGEHKDENWDGEGVAIITGGESYEGIFEQTDSGANFARGKMTVGGTEYEGEFKNSMLISGRQSNISKTWEYEGEFDENGYWIDGLYRIFDEYGDIESEDVVGRVGDGGELITYSGDEAKKKRNNLMFSKRYAFVIGNSNYNQTEDYGNLDNPKNDARLIAESLMKSGFEVDANYDLSQDQFIEKITDFKRKLAVSGRNAIALFYFSGHGLQVDGDNYLVPTDAQIETESDLVNETVSATRIMKAMAANFGGTNIFILDACRDNPFERTFSRGVNSGLAVMNAPDGTYIAYSTGPGKEAADGTDGNSVFTKSLAFNMLEPGLNIEEVFKKTRIEVARKTRNKQIPWSSSSLTVDFYFTPN